VLTRDVEENTVIRAERFLIRQAFINLIQNAADFTPRDGAVSVSLRGDDSGVEFAVTNDGPHLPDYALDRVFDRFYSLPRPDTGEKSSGLGLTFVREVALLHGGEGTIRNRPDGGVKASLRLPMSLPGA
jgi:two-component system sensor histidine kinase CreC